MEPALAPIKENDTAPRALGALELHFNRARDVDLCRETFSGATAEGCSCLNHDPYLTLINESVP